MSILIQRVLRQQGALCSAEVLHGGHVLQAWISGSLEAVAALVGTECIAEIDYDTVTSWRTLPDFKDVHSAIAVSEPERGQARITGRVHNILELQPGLLLMDVYVQAGPEFVSVASSEIEGELPPVGTGIELCVVGMRWYPKHI